ncbi:MAG: polysaccharide deacetylase, partial [Lachnospiraceae bacterium]|nr:polysaccharide deacetylase [Lachnospiraceae bacterium]
MIISITALTYVRRLDKKVDELTDQVSKLELTYMLKAQADEALDTMIADRSDQVIKQEDLLSEQATEPVKEAQNEDASKKKIYLTFDDGPSLNTQRILDTLDEYDVKATFFVTGYQAEKHPEWYKEIVDRGHTIGMHSYSHVYRQIYSSSESFLADIDKLSEYIKQTTGTETRFLRFPGGSSNRVSTVAMSDLCMLMHERGIEYFDWNISSQDATTPAPSAAVITANVLNG